MNLIPILVNIIGATIFGLISLVVSSAVGAGWISILFGLVGIIGWAGLYVAWGFQRIEENRYIVWERLGKFTRISRSGPRIVCLPPYIDRVATDGGDGDFLYHDIKIKSKEEEGVIDFKGGGTGTPVGEINYRVIDNPSIVIPGKSGSYDGAYLYTYTVGDTKDLILRIILGALRQRMQKETIDDASGNLDAISKEIQEDDVIKEALRKMGVELHETKGVVLTDIELDAEVVKARQKVQDASMDVSVAEKRVLEAKQTALRQAKEGEGYIEALEVIYERGRRMVKGFSRNDAMKVLFTMRGLEVLQSHNSSDLTLVGKGLDDVITSIRVGDDHRRAGGA